MEPKLISFYTTDWEYPEHAIRLAKECDTFGIDHFIQEKESTKDYIKNTALKPYFIKDCLEKFKAPVIWVDVDAMILKPFDVGDITADMLACNHMGSHVNREWAVAFLVFNYTSATMQFIDLWCEATAHAGTDEAAFEIAWQKLKDDINIETLPATYHFVKWSNSLVVPEDIIICHQLSKFDDKMKRKNKHNGKVEETDA